MSIPCSMLDLEKKKFAECPEGSGEVVIKTKICDMPPIQVEAEITPGLPAGFSPVNEYAQVSSVPSASPVTIITYTVGVGEQLILSKIEVGGENKATYTVEVDATVEALNRTYYTRFDTEFFFDRLILSAGQTVSVKVEHNSPLSSDHEARIIGITETL